jgi:uncharacterized membrane protein
MVGLFVFLAGHLLSFGTLSRSCISFISLNTFFYCSAPATDLRQREEGQ